jgi:hypothetical protein
VTRGVPVSPIEEPSTGGETVRILGRSDILEAVDLQREIVDVPEWGGSVYVQGMSGTSRDSFERSMVEIRGKESTVNWKNLRAKLVARCIVDSEGVRIFHDLDIEELGNKSAAALQRVFLVAQRLSGMADDEVEELTESLKDAPSEDSGSA